jgi:hypothetical protein
MNVVALVALLAVALAMLVVWRGGRLEAAAFQPAAIVAALRHGAAGSFVTAAVRSGLYERERGAPLLFVRGDVVSRAQAPVRSVRVAVEVVREGTVVARGEALAGALPTPEELWRARSADALAKVARRAAARAPERIGPGTRCPSSSRSTSIHRSSPAPRCAFRSCPRGRADGDGRGRAGARGGACYRSRFGSRPAASMAPRSPAAPARALRKARPSASPSAGTRVAPNTRRVTNRTTISSVIVYPAMRRSGALAAERVLVRPALGAIG